MRHATAIGIRREAKFTSYGFVLEHHPLSFVTIKLNLRVTVSLRSITPFYFIEILTHCCRVNVVAARHATIKPHSPEIRHHQPLQADYYLLAADLLAADLLAADLLAADLLAAA